MLLKDLKLPYAVHTKLEVSTSSALKNHGPPSLQHSFVVVAIVKLVGSNGVNKYYGVVGAVATKALVSYLCVLQWVGRRSLVRLGSRAS